MRKLVLYLLFNLILSPLLLNAQIISTTLEANWVYIPQNPVDFKKPFLFKAGIENWFTRRIALGINAQVGMASIEDEDYTFVNGQIISEKDLEVSNSVYSLNIYSKIAIFSGDDYSISLKPEFGISSVESRPVIYFTDHVSGTVTSTRYSMTSSKSICFGLGIQGQYFITERWDLCLNLGYNNYDLGKSLNRIDLKNEWSHGFNEKTCFISAGLGFHYYLFGADNR